MEPKTFTVADESVFEPNRDLDPNGADDDTEVLGFTANPEAVDDERVPETKSVGAGIPNSPLPN